MPTLDWILEVLGDGKWHQVREILERSKLADSTIKRIIGFLAEYHLIQRDETLQKIRLTPKTLRFLRGIQEIELAFVHAENTGTRRNCE